MVSKAETNKMRLKYKIILTGFAILTITLIVITIFNIHTEKSKYYQDIKQHARIASIYLTLETTVFLGSVPFSAAAKELTDMSGNLMNIPEFRETFTSIWILNAKGKILSHNDPNHLNKFVSKSIWKKIHNTHEEITLKVENSYVVFIPFLSKKTLSKKEIDGFIAIGFSSQIIEKRINSIIKNSIFISVISLVVFFLLYVVVIHRLVILPLNQILKTAHEIEKTGNFSLRINNNSNDEIGGLAKKINKLLTLIENVIITMREEIQKESNPRWWLACVSLLPDEILSSREKQVCGLIQQDLTQKEIAAQLEISPRTVESHVRNSKNKVESYINQVNSNNPTNPRKLLASPEE